MNFRKLSRPENQGDLWVNLDMINCILEAPNGTFLEVTPQSKDSDAYGYLVTESVTEILGLPKDATTTSN